MGNKYRLVVRVVFSYKTIQIKWFGTHREYNNINVKTVRYKMKEKGLKNKDMVGKIGSKGYVSAILNKRKPMTLEIAKFFHKEFGIPAEIFLS